MTAIAMLTVRLPHEELDRLDRMAVLNNKPRSQIVQQAIRDMLDADETLRAKDFQLLKLRLEPAVREQRELLSHSSVADEHRRF